MKDSFQMVAYAASSGLLVVAMVAVEIWRSRERWMKDAIDTRRQASQLHAENKVLREENEALRRKIEGAR